MSSAEVVCPSSFLPLMGLGIGSGVRKVDGGVFFILLQLLLENTFYQTVVYNPVKLTGESSSLAVLALRPGSYVPAMFFSSVLEEK